MENNFERSAGMPDNFDRMLGLLDGLNEVTACKPSTVCCLTPLIGAAQTWIIRTFRHREKGDIVFLECISAETSFRIMLPPEAAEAIARQRDAISHKNRSRGARAAAADRKARGIAPAFLKGKRKKGGRP